MNAIPPSLARPPEPASADLARGAPGGTGFKWAALQEAGAVVSTLAGEAPERVAPEIRNFPALVRDADGWRRAFAEKGIDDLAALMEPGIAALLAVNARGIDARHAAKALWREFVAARAALLALVPSGAMGPPRTA